VANPDGSSTVLGAGPNLAALGRGIAVIGHDDTGIETFRSTFDSPADADDEGYALAVSATGHLAVAGWTRVLGQGHDALVLLFDAAGNLVWVATNDGLLHGSDHATGAAFDGTEVIVSGSTFDGTHTSAWIARFAP